MVVIIIIIVVVIISSLDRIKTVIKYNFGGKYLHVVI